MHFCENCGCSLTEDARFCSKCGNRVAIDHEGAAQDQGGTSYAIPDVSVPESSMVARLWQIPKTSTMGHTITLELLSGQIVAELRKTDIAARVVEPSRVMLSRSGSTWQNKVAFDGEIRLRDAGDRIGIQLLGNKNASKAAAGGLLDVCTGILVCPPLLLCTGANVAMERNYVERSLDSIITKTCNRLGTVPTK